MKKITININIGDLSIGDDVKKIKSLQNGKKPKNLTDEQWVKWKETGNQILKNILT